MTFEEAKALLSTLRRDRCVDHSFGDEEVSWHDDEIDPELHGNIVATGYFSSVRGTARVSVYDYTSAEDGFPRLLTEFVGDQAKALRGCYRTSQTTRNDDPASAPDR